MTKLSCPKCEGDVYRGGFRFWQILVSLVLFPVGLIALLVGRKPTECHRCGFRFIA